jgi:hypothetical protein
MRQDGFKLDFTGNTGVIAPVELKYQLGKNPEDYGGTYNLGGYYDSSARPDLANPKTFTEGLFGIYFEGRATNRQVGAAREHRRARDLRRLHRERPEHGEI